ncbi:hypothetical protein ELI00_37555 [Rhizobium ruizarguesonis]|uniref:hypothetical protein n=1 Tax=Rhizobium ruizarguesonis TaxID=2081791 RepID=UPI00102F3686|nr:hypothetical protein [Rhizobium ruizarguesonis]TAX63351.1 hypothetical protein ELI00_37555 [Rhizobium ruizarguesonis]
MASSADDLARQAAQHLSREFDPNLPALIESQLQAGGSSPERYDPATATAIALAALLLNAAKFAWDIHRERGKDAKEASQREAITRQLRLELPVNEGISTQQRDRIIAVVVEEMTKPS